MIAIPAVDLRAGACVQLVGGSYDAERVRLDNPAAVVGQWVAIGFRRLHVVDLDAALGVGDNTAIIDTILSSALADVQVGGGVRSTERAAALLDAGASRVVVGTRTVEDYAWLAELAGAYPGRVVVAADVKERLIVTHGWERSGGREILDFVRSVSVLHLGGLLVTAVHLEGQMRGTDLPLMEAVANASRCPVIASGGITTLEDLRALDQRGVAAAVVGMALYTGALDSRAVAQEFGQ